MQLSDVREIAERMLLAACALVGASAGMLLLGAVYWGAVFVGFSIASNSALRWAVFVVVCVVGVACDVLLAHSAFRSVEFLIGRRRADSVAMFALLSAAAGLALGTLVRNALYGSYAQVYAPIYILGGVGSIAGVWLGTRRSAHRASSAV
jgi:hypothetical protein